MRDYASELPVLLDVDLSYAGWDGQTRPYPGISSKQYAMQSLRNSLLKKFSDKKSATADRKALELFLSVNSKCKEWCLDSSSLTEVETIAIGEMKSFIDSVCMDYDESTGCFQPAVRFWSIANSYGLGNGANIGSPGTDFLSKVGLSSMSATSNVLHDLFVKSISSEHLWSSVESTRSERKGYEIVKGSRLSFVPKTTEISRTICTEPLLNMLFQKGVAAVLERRLRQAVSLDLSTQADKNRELARIGSETGRFGTIDLSSASDSMSTSLVREFFPSHLRRWLELTRSPVTTLPGGEIVELHMISSMGNAFTFPLQTIFFAAVVFAAYRVHGIPFRRPLGRSLGNFAVFGDDIIVERKAYDLVCRLLMLCGFSVNKDKSFNEGLFRESCGRDYYSGYNVRGIYIKTLKRCHDRYSAINRLNVWSARHGICLRHTVSHLLKGARFLRVPFDEMDVAGVKVHSSHLERIQRNRSTGGINYRFVKLVSPSVRVSDVASRPPRLKGWFDNHSAVLLAALAGTLRSGQVTLRTNELPVRISRRSSSRWDWIPYDQHESAGFAERWKLFVELNLL